VSCPVNTKFTPACQQINQRKKDLTKGGGLCDGWRMTFAKSNLAVSAPNNGKAAANVLDTAFSFLNRVHRVSFVSRGIATQKPERSGRPGVIRVIINTAAVIADQYSAAIQRQSRVSTMTPETRKTLALGF
jgi:hypothetical protein